MATKKTAKKLARKTTKNVRKSNARAATIHPPAHFTDTQNAVKTIFNDGQKNDTQLSNSMSSEYERGVNDGILLVNNSHSLLVNRDKVAQLQARITELEKQRNELHLTLDTINLDLRRLNEQIQEPSKLLTNELAGCVPQLPAMPWNR